MYMNILYPSTKILVREDTFCGMYEKDKKMLQNLMSEHKIS
jgi:hypothetical protein